MELEKQVLAEDLHDAKVYESYALYCMARMNKALSLLDTPVFDYYSAECKRTMNDLKHLRFRKMDKERIVIDAKL